MTCCLTGLVDKGRRQVVPRSSRRIRIVDGLISKERVPIIRQVGPGVPPASGDNVEQTFPADSVVERFRTQSNFLLRLQGESAAEAGPHDGDLVAVREASGARTGELVVACAGR